MTISITVTEQFYLLNDIMEYTIKELEQKWIPKRKIYKTIAVALPISYELIGNKRIFNENDLDIFNHYIKYWEKRTVEKFWTTKQGSSNKTILNSSVPVLEQTQNSTEQLDKIIAKQLNAKIKTVTEQFETEKIKLNQELKQKEKAIADKEIMAKDKAIQLISEKKEKGDWIDKYERLEKKHSNIKVYLAISVVVLLAVSVFLYLVMNNNIKFN